MAKKLSPGGFRPAAILAAKLGAEAIGTASQFQGSSLGPVGPVGPGPEMVERVDQL